MGKLGGRRGEKGTRACDIPSDRRHLNEIDINLGSWSRGVMKEDRCRCGRLQGSQMLLCHSSFHVLELDVWHLKVGVIRLHVLGSIAFVLGGILFVLSTCV